MINALPDFNRALELNPEYVSAYIRRGMTYRNMEQYDQAIQDYNKAIKLNPKNRCS